MTYHYIDEKRYKGLVNNLDVGVIIHAEDTKVIACNPMASKLLGISENLLTEKFASDPSFSFVNEDESIVDIYKWSDSAMKVCAVRKINMNFIVDEAGVWGDVIRQRKPLVLNDYSQPIPNKKGIPVGHGFGIRVGPPEDYKVCHNAIIVPIGRNLLPVLC